MGALLTTEPEATEGYSLVAYDRECADDTLAAAFVEARHVRYRGWYLPFD